VSRARPRRPPSALANEVRALWWLVKVAVLVVAAVVVAVLFLSHRPAGPAPCPPAQCTLHPGATP